MAPPAKCEKTVKILFVQAGDYREAFVRLRNGGAETYYAQQFTVDYVGALTRRVAAVGVLSHADEAYAEPLANGVMGYGLNLRQADPEEVCALIEAFGPTHLVLRVPVLYLLDWALARGVTVLPLLAESFSSGSAAMERYYGQLQARLSHPGIRWIANHNVPACLSLVHLGVAARKIIPYDYAPDQARTPDAYAPKQREQGPGPFKLIFVGSLLVEKGITDCIECVRWARDRGFDVSLTIVGPGDAAFCEALWNSLHLAPYVTYAGVIPNADVIALMRAHDAVLVPSRRAYPEGLPLTLYEALCARTPVIVSDHPMLMAKIKDGETGLVFEAGSPGALGACVAALRSDPVLYVRLSEGTRQAWQQMQCPVRWDQLLDRFIGGTPEDEAWLTANALPAHVPVPSHPEREAFTPSTVPNA